MRAFTVTTLHHLYSSYEPYPSIFLTNANTNAKSLNLISSFSSSKLVLPLSCSSTNPSHASDDFDDNDNDSVFTGEDCDFLEEDGVFIELKKLGRNSRRIRSKIAVEASLDDVWTVLTDYERLSDFIPGLLVSELVEKQENFARIVQIGQQDLPLGLKFSAKVTLDCYERELQVFGSGKRRDIEFKMTEGDFQVFEGRWSVEQLNKRMAEDGDDSSQDAGSKTTLSYLVDIKPKLWLPVKLIEGRLLKEIKTNLTCVRDEAKKLIQNTLHSW